MNTTGSALIVCLVILAVFGAVVMTCLLAAPDPQPILDQVENSVGQFIGGAL